MKKTITILAAAVLLTVIIPATALAHRKGVRNTTSCVYSLCSMANCNIVGRHVHDGITYSGHSINDGHDYHQLCNVSGCTKTGSHKHNGIVCLPHANGDGHGTHSANNGHRRGHH